MTILEQAIATLRELEEAIPTLKGPDERTHNLLREVYKNQDALTKLLKQNALTQDQIVEAVVMARSVLGDIKKWVNR